MCTPPQITFTPTTATQQSEGDGFSAATAAAQAYLDRIGLRSVLEHGVVRLLETNPLPASTLSAWIVLATDITRVIKAQGHGQANDAVASAMLAGFESLVREEGQGRSQKGWWGVPDEGGASVCQGSRCTGRSNPPLHLSFSQLPPLFPLCLPSR